MLKKLALLSLMMAYIISPAVRAQNSNSKEITFTDDGAWCWFQDPRAVYIDGKKECTYAQWVTKNGTLKIGSYNHKNGKIEIENLKTNWDADDHNVGAFLVLPDNRLMVFYARHNREGIYCRTSTNPEDISSWEDEITISDSPRITYAHPFYLADEKTYYVFWRGPSWKPTFSTSKDRKNWSKPQILIQDIGRVGGDIRPYTKITSDNKSSIHFTFTDGHPRVEPQNSVYYLKYEDGKFYKADGTVAGNINSLPIAHKNSDLVYDGKATNVRAWVWDIALDNKEMPVIAYTRLPEETDHRYCYARWNGKKWTDTEITKAGKWFPQTQEGETEREPHYSGGIGLNHANPSELYVSREINGVFEIEKWETPDKGKSWNSYFITKNSDELNVRPVVPRGYSKNKDFVLWMNGDYIHYTNYNTGITLYLED